MNNEDWILASDDELLASIEKHEGNKAAIYAQLRDGRLKAAKNCDAQYCMNNNTWPAYIDSEGLDTVGIGHLITGNEPYDCYAGVSDQDVMMQLSQDVEQHLGSAKKLTRQYGMNIGGNYVVQRFMTELCFNIGHGGYSKFKNGLRKLTAAVNRTGEYTYSHAADEHLDSKWARQVHQRARNMVNTLRALDDI
ncbi:hypothetical protein [Aliikangiella coralliicola]|uniref:Lysozyme n=1 Tax=Aliikangiella coralliicola TaxID=2592383 RepID=A0A545UCV0_9GAMM|nr:hypothetical protein [Aliikangiella coralliicola]TQV87288.1 hypothetical protein FLL46_12620 [Aliikangiella coralliicola]